MKKKLLKKRGVRNVIRFCALLLVILFYVPSFMVSCSGVQEDISANNIAKGITVEMESGAQEITDPEISVWILLAVPVILFIVWCIKSIYEKRMAAVFTGVLALGEFVFWLVLNHEVAQYVQESYCDYTILAGYIVNLALVFVILAASVYYLIGDFTEDKVHVEKISKKKKNVKKKSEKRPQRAIENNRPSNSQVLCAGSQTGSPKGPDFDWMDKIKGMLRIENDSEKCGEQAPYQRSASVQATASHAIDVRDAFLPKEEKVQFEEFYQNENEQLVAKTAEDKEISQNNIKDSWKQELSEKIQQFKDKTVRKKAIEEAEKKAQIEAWKEERKKAKQERDAQMQELLVHIKETTDLVKQKLDEKKKEKESFLKLEETLSKEEIEEIRKEQRELWKEEARKNKEEKDEKKRAQIEAWKEEVHQAMAAKEGAKRVQAAHVRKQREEWEAKQREHWNRVEYIRAEQFAQRIEEEMAKMDESKMGILDKKLMKMIQAIAKFSKSAALKTKNALIKAWHFLKPRMLKAWTYIRKRGKRLRIAFVKLCIKMAKAISAAIVKQYCLHKVRKSERLEKKDLFRNKKVTQRKVEVVEQKAFWKCGVCDQKNHAESNYCVKCGRKKAMLKKQQARRATNYCYQCGSPLRIVDRFCGQCGASCEDA